MTSTWRSVRARYLFREIVERGHDLPLASVTKDGGVEFRSDLEISVWNPGSDTSSYKRVLPGDFVIGLRSFQSGLGASPIEGLVSPAYTVLRASTGAPVHHGFFKHYFKSSLLIAQLENVAQGIRQGRTISTEDFYNLRLPVPPMDEQRAIAEFLDSETTRIDALIAKKQHMVDLVEEQARSRLTALTTGLHLRCSRRPSRSQWYEDLPEHWRVAKVRFLTDAIVDGPHVSPTYVDDEGKLFISVRNIRVDGWDLSTAKRISSEDYENFSQRVRPQRGDLLLTKGGTTGVARVVDFDEPFQVWVHVAVLKVRGELIDPVFLAAALNSTPGYAQSQLYTRGATNQDLALGRIAEIEVPLPPRDTQEQLVTMLRSRERQQVALRKKLGRQIDRLREHRQALITAAVAGELDVPGVAA